MAIKDILIKVSDIAAYYRIDKPYIVGGLPRDIYLKKEIKTNDVDLTTNSPDVMRLGILVAEDFNVPFELSDDGHVTVFTDKIDIDFSSHFISKKVKEYLDGKHQGFEEAFSRDFTINALHQDLKTYEFFDPTGMAVQDIENKIIRTPVPAEITLNDDPRRAYRAVNLAVRYDFTIDSEIIEFVKSNPDLFTSENIKDKYITIKINKALNQDPDKTINLLQALELFENVPLSGQFKDILIEKKMLADYLGSTSSSKKSYLKNNYFINKFSNIYLAKNWKEYSSQGPAYKELEEFWKQNYNEFSDYNSPDYNSWTRWYMDRYRGVWGKKHKGPKEALRLMQEEMSSGVSKEKGFPFSIFRKKKKDTTKEIKENTLKKNFFQNISKSDNYMENVNKGKYVDLKNTTSAVKSFIKILGEAAKKMDAEMPYITSGYRSAEHQAQIMFNNWKANGGMNGGREYLKKIYNDTYASKVADIFESHRGHPRAARKILPIVNKYGSRHMKKPAQAIDLRLTKGITDVLYAIKNSGRFSMKLVDERNVAGPHWHVTIYEDLKNNTRKARMKKRKSKIIEITG